MTRRICVVTGTRAEYGLLRGLLQRLRASDAAELQLVVTGMHLSPEFGSTLNEIEADGFVVAARVEMLLSADTATGVSKSMGLGMIGFADTFGRLRPDIIVVLGDRFEIFAAAAAALVAGIPLAHIHGGETTEGAFDESIRHAVTKMAHLHFVAAEPYRRRVVQLGENPAHVFRVGGLGVDAITELALLDRADLEASLGFALGERSLLVTFHPATADGGAAASQMAELLAALAQRPDTQLIFTMPNADTGSRGIAGQINDFVAAHPNARAYASLGQLRYLSCMQFVDGVVGNSSSGLAEAPSFGIGTIDIGDRQRGRLRAATVIHCPPARDAIAVAIDRLYDPTFRAGLANVENPYGTGGAAAKITEILCHHAIDNLIMKHFHDLDTVA
jgi:GDP/UDP-N,N'-diacetylbacillosamine 2-epimerase (hydrolysing)